MCAMDRETLDLLRETVRQLVAEETDRSLMERLLELGWSEPIEDDPVAPYRMLFEQRGRQLSADDVLNATLTDQLAEAIGDASLRGGVLVLAPTLGADSAGGVRSGGALRIDGVALAPPACAPLVVRLADGFAIAKASEGLESVAIEGFDPALGLCAVRGELPEGEVVLHADEPDASAWTSTVTRARWLLASELLGVGQQVLEDAVAYTNARKQYGVAIGSFQAIQHRMASAHGALVGADHATEEAARTGEAWPALIAKALAGRAAEDACSQAQQGWGALGFTWEQDFHRFLRRTYSLDRLFGDYRTLEFEIGSTLQASRKVPRVGSFAGLE